MQFLTAQRAVDFLLENSTSSSSRAICFYGGEPLLQWKLIRRIIEYANTRSQDPISYHLTTNGLMLRARPVREMVRRYGVHVMLSIDGPARIHNLFRRKEAGGPTHSVVEGALRALIEEDRDFVRHNVLINAVAALPNRLMEMAQHFCSSPLYAELPKGAIRYNGADPFGDNSLRKQLNAMAAVLPPATNPTSPREAFVSARSRSPVPADRLETIYMLPLVRIAHRPIRQISSTLTPSGFCVPGTRKLFVSVEGYFAICEKTGGTFRIGDVWSGINIDSVMNIMAGMHDLWSTKCSGCIAQRFCGSCPAVVNDGTGQLDSAAFKRECRLNVVRFQQSLEDFVRICDANPDYLRELEAVVVS
jgi:uncharacterized protein